MIFRTVCCGGGARLPIFCLFIHTDGEKQPNTEGNQKKERKEILLLLLLLCQSYRGRSEQTSVAPLCIRLHTDLVDNDVECYRKLAQFKLLKKKEN